MIELKSIPDIVRVMRHCLGIDYPSTYQAHLHAWVTNRNYVYLSEKDPELYIWEILEQEGLADRCTLRRFFVTEEGIAWLSKTMGTTIYCDYDPDDEKRYIANFNVSFNFGIKVSTSDFEEIREEIEEYFFNVISTDAWECTHIEISDLYIQFESGDVMYEPEEK